MSTVAITITVMTAIVCLATFGGDAVRSHGWKYSRKPWEIRWQDSEAVQHVRAHRDHPEQETRIVRRLVSTPEAIDE